MTFRKILYSLSFIAFILLARQGFAQNNGWESEIREFEKKDSLSMPAPGGIVFTGSSSIRKWETLNQDYPNRPVLNRGFGGSQIEDAVEYFDRIVAKYQPRQVVLYSGDNDIASGKSPDVVLKDFKKFAEQVKQKLPDAELVFLSIKPSLARWDMYDKMQEANRKIEKYASGRNWIKYVDVASPMLGADGKPMPELFVEDGLHMTREGYKLWTGILEPYLLKQK
ncbi:SGNH/GDSL hydrolase family protein [Pontibacter silvestris]|uniref:SGNH/GDSL hydrolase family protein n=1 Tax=Pontibacter silvestris TaxID=2305183 RepID=A0ABW4X2X1_9BACT|nr:SGNH/GDSL hydrolase family protein [Pontibacter silvestris]MCC9137146.1 GDSL-type esterase/lipase family protein [Pontibacter silvestris]